MRNRAEAETVSGNIVQIVEKKEKDANAMIKQLPFRLIFQWVVLNQKSKSAQRGVADAVIQLTHAVAIMRERGVADAVIQLTHAVAIMRERGVADAVIQLTHAVAIMRERGVADAVIQLTHAVAIFVIILHNSEIISSNS